MKYITNILYCTRIYNSDIAFTADTNTGGICVLLLIID